MPVPLCVSGPPWASVNGPPFVTARPPPSLAGGRCAVAAHLVLRFWLLARGIFGDRFGGRADMIGRGAAAPANQVHQPVPGKFLQFGRELLWRFVIFAELIGQAGIGVGTHQRVRLGRQIGDRRAQIFRAEGAIHADGEGFQVPHGVPEGFRGLARQIAARQIGDGA